MADISLDIDLFELVGEMPTVPCEHSNHANHGDLPATHYIEFRCPVCPYHVPIFAVCDYIIRTRNTPGHGVFCTACSQISPAVVSWIILGKV